MQERGLDGITRWIDMESWKVWSSSHLPNKKFRGPFKHGHANSSQSGLETQAEHGAGSATENNQVRASLPNVFRLSVGYEVAWKMGFEENLKIMLLNIEYATNGCSNT